MSMNALSRSTPNYSQLALFHEGEFVDDDPKLPPLEINWYALDLLADARQVVDYDEYLAKRQPGHGMSATKQAFITTEAGNFFDVVVRYEESEEKDAEGQPLRREAHLSQVWDPAKPVPNEPFTLYADVAWHKPEDGAIANRKTGIWGHWYNPEYAKNDAAQNGFYTESGFSQKWNTGRAVLAVKGLFSQLLNPGQAILTSGTNAASLQAQLN